jgi:hypothetical protein
VIKSFLSLPFFKPPKAILVPGMYFFGFSRYSNYGKLANHETPFQIHLTYESTLIPGDSLLLVGIGVGESFNLAGLTTEKTVQVWSDLVTICSFCAVALRASCLEETSTLRGVT